MIDARRERILGRVRTAVQVKAQRPPAATNTPVFPAITNPREQFLEEFNLLRGERINSADDLATFLKQFPRIAVDQSDLARATVGEGNADVRQADLGVSGCDCLVAQTGSIIVSPASTGGRAISVLPPVHLVIARWDQLVPDLATAMSLLKQRYQHSWPSTLTVITGPSRTADIEKILVMGAHGPKRLVLYVTE